jgi:hypothetical protein
MLSKLFLSFFVTILIISPSFASAQDIRIRFAKGRTSATMTAASAQAAGLVYFASAKGQSLNATLSSKSGRVAIFETGETSYNYVIELSATNRFASIIWGVRRRTR